MVKILKNIDNKNIKTSFRVLIIILIFASYMHFIRATVADPVLKKETSSEVIPCVQTSEVISCFRTLLGQQDAAARPKEPIAEPVIAVQNEIIPSQPEPKFIPLDVPMCESQQAEVYEICKNKGLSFTLVIAIIERESNFDASARSNTGDTGLMQINDCNKQMLAELGYTDLTDPIQNIQAGTYILAQLAEKYEVPEALMAYNMGERNAKKLWDKGIFESKYSKKITEREAEFSKFIDNLTMSEQIN